MIAKYSLFDFLRSELTVDIIEHDPAGFTLPAELGDPAQLARAVCLAQDLAAPCRLAPLLAAAQVAGRPGDDSHIVAYDQLDPNGVAGFYRQRTGKRQEHLIAIDMPTVQW